MKNILIIATGGTIAGVGNVGETAEYQAGVVHIHQILENIPNVNTLGNLSGLQLYNVSSGDITTDRLIKLANTINALSQDENYDGFVITHGTDTLEETAYFLNLTLKTTKPVVLTGSMRPTTATSADGPQNLYESIAVAACEESVGKGVLVVFSDGIFSAREVTKVNTQRTDAFSGRDFGLLGYIHDDSVEYINTPLKINTIKSCFNIDKNSSLKEVPIAYFHINADTALLEYMLDNYEGLVIAGAGNGCVSEKWENLLAKDKYAHKPIIISSRISNGKVVNYNSIATNCISSGTLNPQKSRLLLQLCMTKTMDIKEITKFFSIY